MNEQVAALLREYAELTVITGGDVFRVRNYEKAARSIRGWPEDIARLDLKALRAIPGVGASIRFRPPSGWGNSNAAACSIRRGAGCPARVRAPP